MKSEPKLVPGPMHADLFGDPTPIMVPAGKGRKAAARMAEPKKDSGRTHLSQQCCDLLAALRQGDMNTGEIRGRLGIGDPATRVFDLKAWGFVIETAMVKVPTRHPGKQARVAKYHLKGVKPNTNAAAGEAPEGVEHQRIAA